MRAGTGVITTAVVTKGVVKLYAKGVGADLAVARPAHRRNRRRAEPPANFLLVSRTERSGQRATRFPRTCLFGGWTPDGSLRRSPPRDDKREWFIAQKLPLIPAEAMAPYWALRVCRA
jgi:hypothetical protein